MSDPTAETDAHPEGVVHWAVDGHVAIATLDRPDRKNAMSAEMAAALRARVADSHDVRVVVITGAGDAFCAGADLVTRFDDGADTFRPEFEGLQDTLEAFPGVTIAAVNGPAMGAGTQLITACDVVVAADRARFGIPAAKLGLMLTAANTIRLARRVGDSAARDLLLTARVIDAPTALTIGLVNRCVPDALVAARELAEEVAALAPLSVTGHKQALNEVRANGAPDAHVRQRMDALTARAQASTDLREGVAAFREKRPPRFRGE